MFELSCELERTGRTEELDMILGGKGMVRVGSEREKPAEKPPTPPKQSPKPAPKLRFRG